MAGYVIGDEADLPLQYKPGMKHKQCRFPYQYVTLDDPMDDRLILMIWALI